ncbi:serine/threonine-protein kinase [Xanthomonas campestris pv. campestris]|uniref:serine/threonine-protein kinase n=1 Tax=Xanthomonas campestris TaxID=339 RepID=UPI002B36AFC7|nr:serine/threonine-protein kinase [Xanthomonas campestris pv. campestris]
MSSNALSQGQLLIDRYRIESYLNQGGMQEVYLCTDTKLQRKAVIKTPKGGVADKRFQRGAEMSARINHHNIAATLDYFEIGAHTFMVEELIEGLDLAKRLSTEFEVLDPALAAHVIHNIARALQEAHSRQICHRDLKPSNIMVSADPAMTILKLTDFGIAKLAENEIAAEMSEFERDESTLTNSNTLLGAIPYMAPEAWSNWRGAGQPLDIWSLGCIAYQLVTGKLPFGSGRPAIMAVARLETTRKVSLSKPPLFGRSPARATLESHIWKIILDCIKVDPEERPTALEILNECGSWCYNVADRKIGTITSYGASYSSGGKGKTGKIVDSQDSTQYFYHLSEYYATALPKIGTKVSVGVYPGDPWPRASPVLPFK